MVRGAEGPVPRLSAGPTAALSRPDQAHDNRRDSAAAPLSRAGFALLAVAHLDLDRQLRAFEIARNVDRPDVLDPGLAAQEVRRVNRVARGTGSRAAATHQDAE